MRSEGTVYVSFLNTLFLYSTMIRIRKSIINLCICHFSQRIRALSDSHRVRPEEETVEQSRLEESFTIHLGKDLISKDPY